jgi:hypothetical protein
MPRLLILALVALFTLSSLMAISTTAQEGQQPPEGASDLGEWPWEGVGPIVEVPPEDTEAWANLTDFIGLQDLDDPDKRSLTALLPKGYRVPFQNLPDERDAYVPEIIGAEFMVVIVEEGEFVLDAKGPGSYLVDPAPIGGEERNLEIMIGKIPPDEKEIYYEETGLFIVDENGDPCGRMCTVLPGFAVKLAPGDRVIAPAGAVCVWCLFQRPVEDTSTPEAGATEELAKGKLLVFPLVRDGYMFSWLRYYKPGGGPGTPEATQSAGQVFSGALRAAPEMAVLAFNPGPGCSRGSG